MLYLYMYIYICDSHNNSLTHYSHDTTNTTMLTVFTKIC